MSKAVLAIAKFPETCAECVKLYGDENKVVGFCGGGDCYIPGMAWEPAHERAPFCPLIELPGEIEPEDCEVYKVGQEEELKEDEKELLAYGTAMGWNTLLDVLTEGKGSDESKVR